MREKRLPFEAVETASSCTKRARMSRKLGVGEIDLHHQVMSGGIDNIQDHRYRMSRRTFFQPSLKCTTGITYVGLRAPGWLYVLGNPPRADLPS